MARGTSRLGEAGVPSPRVDAEILAAHVLGVSRSQLLLSDGFTEQALLEYVKAVETRASGVPVQHITGRAPFRHVELAVGPGVFVPRPETELLADWGLAALAGHSRPVVVDLCSGSGAIALAVANERPDATVFAVERSPEALTWLRRNAAERSEAGDPPVTVVEGDVADASVLAELNGTVDLVLCNPPYVPLGTKVAVEVDHDPPQAVFGGAEGLDLIPAVIRTAARLLGSGGSFAVEHDETHGAEVPALLREDGRFAVIRLRYDLAQRARYTTAHKA
ncbi:peptide chain release factor N(5)-glutamine methyltransferase [Catenuloplanes atrovinosus]|uniref:Release factor glutamine methyltransferase n=1 Tax=Catenuloplanes atrovinosus TaxID=137266 RepID=A0AAE3YXK5_9ACTN|nr:peptide chain release factor N(5)-glutamine methyltransferase [Catenuloplanes atrovinosus]MDR7281047.1 release factor glutamine methyltransferase [Catenuloplanes atrovinosus]